MSEIVLEVIDSSDWNSFTLSKRVYDKKDLNIRTYKINHYSKSAT